MAEVSRAVSEPQIAALVARSLTSFKALTSTLQDDHTRASQSSSCLARFKLWAGNLGAHRPSGSRSLEYRLRDASNIRKLVISLLQDLCTLVANGGSIPDTVSESHDEVEDDLADYFNEDEDSDRSEVEQILDEIAHVADCLLRLSVTIRNPAPHDQFLSRAGEGLVKEFVYWDAKHVQDKFPNVDKDLADRLGRAMARRRQYFKYREEHKSRLAEGLDEDDADFGGRATTIASSLPEHLKEASKSTEASQTQLAILDDGRSDASATSYATSSPDSTQLRVPPIPKEHIDGSFKCPFCHMIVSIDTRHAWKKHVFRDLRPYVCLSEACQAPDHLYTRRNDWKMHMRREHWKTWYCPFGCDAEFDSAKGFHSHVKTAHEQNVSLEKIHALEGLSSRADIENAKGRCPLCYDFQIESKKQYEKHVGQHLEHLALFTLPDTGGEGDDDEDGNEDKEEERLDDGDEDDDDDEEEEDEEEDWLATDDPRTKVADQQQKAATEASDKLNREAQESREIHQAAKKIIVDGDKEALAEAVASFEEESKMAAAVAEAKGATEKAAQELKEKIQKETKAKPEESEKAEQAPIRFKDAVGRHFAFPFRLCATWQGMEDLIKQSFPQVEVVGPHVMEGRYDLIGPDSEIILPSVWEKVVQPDWAITMRMWPGYEMPPSRTRWTHQPVKSPPPAPRKEDPEKIRLEAELAAFKAMEEKQKAAEKEKEVEAQIRKEATRIAQEEVKEEIKKARIGAGRAAREDGD
ncbi:C2H2-type domain-containing protein [Fusarium keratoplasticum]|nr:C2H2-type domain-containing protein [Fusarium keratoplasticum]